MASKTFSFIISLDTNLIKVPKSFYRDYFDELPSRLWIETEPGTRFPTHFVDSHDVPYIETKINEIMNLFRVDGLIGTPTRREDFNLCFKGSLQNPLCDDCWPCSS